MIITDMVYDKKKISDFSEITRQNELITEKQLADIVSEYADDFVGVLNNTRQFVMINTHYFKNSESVIEFLGKRPGETFGCIHGNESEYGCGNFTACEYCGALITVIEAIKTKRRVTMDSRLMVERGGAGTLNIRVTAIPLDVDDEVFILLFVKDISRDKQIELLERAFFHDVLNTSNSLKSIVALSKVSSEIIPDADKSIEMNISDIVEQIQYFQKLKMAEEGEMSVSKVMVDLAKEVKSIVESVRNANYSKGITISLEIPDDGFQLLTDKVLYRRIVLNLVKNATEASFAGDEIMVRLFEESEYCRLEVVNPAVMTQEVSQQVFQRAFSTKGPGRGIGTYSIKILGERYLGGKVEFSSTDEDGTVFSFIIPMYNEQYGNRKL